MISKIAKSLLDKSHKVGQYRFTFRHGRKEKDWQ